MPYSPRDTDTQSFTNKMTRSLPIVHDKLGIIFLGLSDSHTSQGTLGCRQKGRSLNPKPAVHVGGSWQFALGWQVARPDLLRPYMVCVLPSFKIMVAGPIPCTVGISSYEMSLPLHSCIKHVIRKFWLMMPVLTGNRNKSVIKQQVAIVRNINRERFGCAILDFTTLFILRIESHLA